MYSMSPSAESKLGERVAALEVSAENLNRNVDRLTTSINELITARIHGSKTPWGVVLSAIGIAIVIIGLLGRPYDIQQKHHEDRINRLSDAYKKLDERLEKIHR
jgi:chaperonin cofactor prefoldin